MFPGPKALLKSRAEISDYLNRITIVRVAQSPLNSGKAVYGTALDSANTDPIRCLIELRGGVLKAPLQTYSAELQTAYNRA
jgi:hypothetical protein